MRSQIRNWVIFALACVPAMSAPIIKNAGFESGTDPVSYTTITQDGDGPADWTVIENSIDYIGSYWQTVEGSRSIDLNGVARGGVWQLVNGFTIGGYYELSFYLAGNPDGGPPGKEVILSVTGQPDELFSFNTTGQSHGSMGWEQRTFGFTANATDLEIKFQSNTIGSYGPAIDSISLSEDLTAVPEPASMVLLGLGLAAVGLARRRR